MLTTVTTPAQHKAALNAFARLGELRETYYGQSGLVAIPADTYDAMLAQVHGETGLTPNNALRAAVGLYEAYTDPASLTFAYVSSDAARATDWMGNDLGLIEWRTRSTRPAFTLHCLNGRKYRGQAFPASGTYCRLKLAEDDYFSVKK